MKIKMKDQGLSYQIYVADESLNKELSSQMCSYIKDLTTQDGNSDAYIKYYEAEHSNLLINRFSLFLALEEVKNYFKDSPTIKFMVKENVNFNNFMHDDELYQKTIEVLVKDKILKSNKKNFGSRIIHFNKTLHRIKIAELVDFVNLCGLVDEYFSTHDHDNSYNFFIDFMKDQFELCSLKTMRLELKVNYYKDYWGYINAYSEAFGRFSTVSNMQIFLYLFTEKYNKVTNSERSVSNIRRRSHELSVEGDTNFKFYILYTYYKDVKNFDKLVDALMDYRFTTIKVFKDFIESVDGTMPVEWQVEFFEELQKNDKTSLPF